MSSQNDETTTPSELESLKAKADLMGIQYHPAIGADKLRVKIQAHLNDQPPPADDTQAPAAAVNGEVVEVKETANQRKLRKIREANTLVRVRITCMNSAKKEWPGEFITAGNSVVGSFTKFIPFNASEDGYHVPRIILNQLRDRMCQVFVNEKSKNGVTMRRGKLVKEFAIEELPALTAQELQDLAHRQAMAKSVD